jgi:hypothetical protein
LVVPKRDYQESVVMWRSKEFIEVEGTHQELRWHMHENTEEENIQNVGRHMLVEPPNLSITIEFMEEQK